MLADQSNEVLSIENELFKLFERLFQPNDEKHKKQSFMLYNKLLDIFDEKLLKHLYQNINDIFEDHSKVMGIRYEL